MEKELRPELQSIVDKLVGVRTKTEGSANPELDRIREIRATNKPAKGLFGDTTEAISGIKASVDKRVGKFQEIQQAEASGEQGFFRSALQKFGQGAGLASDVIGGTLLGGIKQLTPDVIQKPVGEAVEGAVEAVVETEPVQKLVSWYSNLDADKRRDLDAIIGVGSLATDVVGGAFAKKPVTAAIGKGLDVTTDIAKKGVQATKDVTQSVGNVVGLTKENLSTIPNRIATNLAEKKVTREAIRELPSKVAQRSVINGVDINDAKSLYRVAPEQKQFFKPLVEAVKKFDEAGGVDVKNPIEVVGKPIVQRLKTLDALKSKLGQRLGDVADELGTVTKVEVLPEVLSQLTRVKGLNGLALKGNKLDFTNTVLATAGSASDRKAIQSIFDSAIKSGTGKQKHLLRQELFEILGGKKKSLTNITDTQEKAFEAVRKGLSNILDTKNAKYKALNTKYAKVVQPLRDMQKLMKVAGETDDIMEMSAGLLARSLTSNAARNPQIRALLKSLDNATSIKGKTQISIEKLQNMYNLLDKYFDISGRTTIQSQVRTGVEKAGGIQEFISKNISELAGQTGAVKKKAILDLLEDALK